MSGAVHQPKPIARRQAKTARQPLLSSCAVAAALAAAGHGAPLWAQSYIADVASTTNATVRTGPGTTTVTVSGSTAIVNWTATNNPGTDGVVAFQNAGTNAYFESTGGDYRVLNRVLTSGGNPISFAGTTESVIGSIDGGPRGGTLWFYSPGGVILGPTARFDVGSLGLSTLDILDSDFLDGNTSFSLAGSADSRARVTLMPGAQINALNEGSYVAIVSPRIDQGGTVSVNGSAAYVAAEAADITINGGLFNIAVSTGSVVNTGGETTLTHSGATQGPSSNGGSDTHAIYMVAVPKNDAVTMLVSGTAGYDPAASASIENGVVVLASGVNLTSASNGLGAANVTTAAGPAPAQNANFTISDATINSRLTGFARTNAAILQGSGTSDFASSVSLKAGGTASVTIQGSGIVAVGGDLTLDATATGSTGTTTGGTARIDLTNGTLLVDNDVLVDASATGSTGANGGDAQGGTATITLANSALTANLVGGSSGIIVRAAGTGGRAADGGIGGLGHGGTASIAISDLSPSPASALTANNILVSAQGTGGGIEFGYGSGGGTGGGGAGGTASLTLNGGGVAAQNVDVLASGSGVSGQSGNGGPDGGNGGQGTGGSATLTVDAATLVAVNGISLAATGQGGNGGSAFEFGYGASGNGGSGGEGQGGTATFTQNGAVSSPFFSLDTTGTGGFGGSSASLLGGAGGDGIGGTTSATLAGGAFVVSSSLALSAHGFGQSGGSSDTATIGGAGGLGQGGTASFFATGGSATLFSVGIAANSEGGRGASGSDSETGPGGQSLAGLAELDISGGTIELETLDIRATAQGADSFAGTGTGDARGGTARLILSDSGALTVSSGGSFGSIGIDASAEFDDSEGASDGDAFGGTASFLVENGGTFSYAGSNSNPLSITADADASTSFLGGTGTGANATGGTASLTVNGADLVLPGLVSISATGDGGDGLDGGNGGIGQGGTASIFSGGGPSGTPGSISLSNIELDANGSGGDAAEEGYGFGISGGNGGAGIGGTATFETLNGSITVTSAANLFVDGSGGDAADGGSGGSGTGGTASLLSGADNNGVGLIDIAGLTIDASGEGASSFETGYGVPPSIGGNGGAATGGAITIGTAGGTLTLASVDLSADASGGDGGFGGAGGNGGAATGGSVTITAGGSALDLSSSFLSINISTDGGNGGSANSVSGAGGNGGNGGNATGGSITLAVSGEDGELTLDPGNIIVSNGAGGGSGGDGGSGTTGGRGGDGGGATGGLVQITTNLGSLTFAGVEGTGPSISVSASGGDGGLGGDGSNVGDTGGDGGSGGDGTGGTISVEVNGGSANFGFTEFFAHGNGGFGGSGGTGAGATTPPPAPTPASQGIDGVGRGGTVSIIVNDDADTGAAGSASFAETTIDVGGFFNDGFEDVGGRIEIHDNGTAPGGGIEFFSLDAVSRGFTSDSDQELGEVFDLFSAERRIAVLTDATIDLGGAAYFRATGGGGLDVGGTLDLDADFFAFVQHDFQPEIPADTISAGNILARTGSNFIASAGSRITATGDIDISSDFGSIDLNFVGTSLNLAIRSANTVAIGGANVGGFIDVESSGNVTRFDNIMAGGDIEVDAGYDLSALDDDNVVLNPNASVTAGNVTSTGGEIDIEATGSVMGGNLSAGHELSITSLTGSITLDSAAAGTLAVPPSPDNNRSIGLLAATDITINGSATAAADIGLGAITGSISAGSLNAGANVALLAADTVDVGAVNAPFFFYIGGSSSLTAGIDPTTISIFDLPFPPDRTGGDVSINGPVTAGAILISSGGTTSFTDMTAAAGFALIDSGGAISGNSIDAFSSIDITGDDAVAIGSLSAGETGYGSFGGNIFIDADGDISVGSATAVGDIDIFGGANVDLDAATAFAFESGYGISGGNLAIRSADTVAIGGANVGGFIDIESNGDVTRFDDIMAGGDIEVDAGYDLSELDDDNVVLNPNASVTAGNVTSTGGEIDIEATGTVAGGDLSAGHELSITSLTGSITLDSAAAGTLAVPPSSENNRSIGLRAANNVTIRRNATAAADIGLGALTGSISVGAFNSVTGVIVSGSLNAGENIVLLAGEAVNLLASVSAPSLFYVANSSMLPVLGTGLQDYNPANLFGVTPARTGGNVLIAPLSTSPFMVASGINAGRIVIASGGSIGFTDMTSSSFVQLDAGSTISGNSIDAFSSIDITGDDAVDIGSLSAGETGYGGGSIFIDADGDITVGSATAVGDIDIFGGANVDLGAATAFAFESGYGISGGNLFVSAASILLDSADAASDISLIAGGTIDAGSLVAGGDIDLDSLDNISVGAAAAGGNILLHAAESVAVDTILAGGTVDLTSENAEVAVLTDLASGEPVTATGTSIELNALGDLDVDEAIARDDVSIRAAGDLRVNNAYATSSSGTMELVGGFPFNSEGTGYLLDGDLTVTGTVSAGSYVHLDGGGDVTITDAARVRSDGDIDIHSGDDIFIQGGALVGLGAASPPVEQPDLLVPDQVGGPADSVSIEAGLLRFGGSNLPENGASSLNVDGTIRGLLIDLASEAIEIGSAASIGDADTNFLAFANNGTARTFIGGSGDANGYALSNAEFSRSQAAQITIFGGGNGSNGLADVVLQNLDILGTQAAPSSGPRQNLVGNAGALFIRSDGSIRVEGDVELTQAALTDRLFLSADNRIDVITPSGSITVTGAQNALAGRIGMSARQIFVGSEQAAQAIAALSSTDAIDERLGTADGDLRPKGFLQANGLDFAIEDALYIQNSGGPGLGSTARAGFTAGIGGVIIETGESSNARIVINGRQNDGNGGFVGGADLIPLLTINGQHNPTGGFDLRSTANGCLIVGSTCRFDMEPLPEAPLPEAPPVQDVIDAIVDAPDDQENQDGTAVVQALNLPMIQLVDTAGLSFEPLIDEPVTGAGNDDFWIGGEGEPDGEKQ